MPTLTETPVDKNQIIQIIGKVLGKMYFLIMLQMNFWTKSFFPT